MRVTDRLKMRTSTRQLQKLSVQNQQATQEAMTGKRVQHASDDSVSFGAASRMRQERVRQQGFLKSGAAAESYFTQADSALDSATDVLTRARELAVQLSSETLSPAQLEAGAQEVDALKQSLVDLGNTRFNGSYIFGGTADDAPPFDELGTYTGSASARDVSVGEGASVTYFAGDEVFRGAGDALGTLSALSDHLAAGRHDDVRASLTSLDSALDDVGRARQHAGSELGAISHARGFGENLVLNHHIEEASQTDADFADTISRMTQARTSYEANIEIASRMKEMTGQILRL